MFSQHMYVLCNHKMYSYSQVSHTLRLRLLIVYRGFFCSILFKWTYQWGQIHWKTTVSFPRGGLILNDNQLYPVTYSTILNVFTSCLNFLGGMPWSILTTYFFRLFSFPKIKEIKKEETISMCPLLGMMNNLKTCLQRTCALSSTGRTGRTL